MNNACNINIKDLLITQYLVKKIKLNNNSNTKILSSNNLTRTVGRGMEYAESRTYQPGDDVRHIDWRITARQGKTYTKLFHEEKGENNYIIVDLSSSLYFGTGYALKSVIACKIAACLSWLGHNEHNNVGGIAYNNNNDFFQPARMAKNNILLFFNKLISAHKPELISYKNNNSLNNILNKYETLIHSNSRIFIISDFLNISDSTYRKIQKLNHDNMITFIRVADPIEKTNLPNGQFNISNGSNSTSINVDKNNQQIFKDFFAHKLINYKQMIKKLNVNNIEIYTTPKWYEGLILNL